MHKTYILGNSGFAQEVFEQVILRDEKANFGGFLIIKQEKAYCISEEGVNLFKHDKNASFILGTSNPVWREKLIILLIFILLTSTIFLIFLLIILIFHTLVEWE